MIRAVTYSASNMSISMAKCIDAAFEFGGVDSMRGYTREEIEKTSFYQSNKSILDAERGAGYWLWKPYVIQQQMNECEDGDVLMYIDAGCELITSVEHITRSMDDDIFFCSNGHRHVDWCKIDVIREIIRDEYEKGLQFLTSFQQVQASLIFFKVNNTTRSFVNEWLLYCEIPGFIDDSPSKLPNHPEFAEHRYDQAILTCLQIKYGYKLHWWPDALWYTSQKYRWPEDKYPAILRHHRKRNADWV